MEAPKSKKRFVLAMVVRASDDPRDPEFLVIESVSTDLSNGKKSKVQLKFPGGTERLEDEPLDVMLRREVLEETNLNIDPDKAIKVWEKQVSPEHTKHGFLIPFSDCHGTIRTEQLNGNGDDMSPPFWKKASALKFALFDGHQPAPTEGLRYLQYHPLL